MVGTDTSVRLVVQGFSIHEELANFIAVGLTPYEALRCATSEPARFLGQSEVWGTVAEGKRADLILVRGNPLNSIETLRDLGRAFSSTDSISQEPILMAFWTSKLHSTRLPTSQNLKSEEE